MPELAFFISKTSVLVSALNSFSRALHRGDLAAEEGPAAADGRLPLHRLQQRAAGGLKEDHPERQL